MIPTEILFAIVAGVAFYVGYRMGRLSAQAEAGATRHGQGGLPAEDHVSPLPGPSAGGEPARSPRSSLPRTAAPPPARAGLMDPGDKSNTSTS